MTRPRVLVLKERNASSDSDPYEAALDAAGYDCEFLPVLAHSLVNLDKIADIVSTGHVANPSHPTAGLARVSGVIFTSQRAVEAWAEGGRRATAAGQIPAQDWSHTPFYAVGPATAAALAHLEANIRPKSTSILGGTETGSADKLASFIDTRHAGVDETSTLRPVLLYLVGDKRKDTLPSLLEGAGLCLVEMQAYETFESPNFADGYARLASLSPSQPFDWVVFFSPSGAKLLLPLLAERPPATRPRFASIGPTTRDCLLSQKGIRVHAMAESPTPDSLVSAMLRAAYMPC